MPIEFHHAPPVAALSSLAQHAGAVDAHRKRRAELEAMNMQMLRMQKQEQQQGLDRVFNAWRTQYGEVSALQRMKADQRFRDAQQEKAAAQQMKGWDIQQEGMDRRQDADNVAAMKRQQDELRARGDAASMKAADDMMHGLIKTASQPLNGNGRSQVTEIMGQMVKVAGSNRLSPQAKMDKKYELLEQVIKLKDQAANTVVLHNEPGDKTDHGSWSEVVGPDGVRRTVINYLPKDGYKQGIKDYEDMVGAGNVDDYNNDGIPDRVKEVEWGIDDTGRPSPKSVRWTDIKPGLGAETPRQKQESRSNWIGGMMDSIESIDQDGNKIKMPVFSAGAPQDMIQKASELSPWKTDAEGNAVRAEARFGEGERIPVSPAMRRSQLIAIANEYYQRMYETQAPGAPQAPGVGSNRLDPDMQKELLKHYRPRQYSPEEEQIDRHGRPPSGDFKQPDFPPTPDREAAEGLMGPLDDAPVAREQAEAARQGLAKQSGTTKHRLLMEGQEEPARLIAEFESIDQNPNMPPEEKRARREAILLQLKKLKADELRNSGMFDKGGR